MVRIHDRTPRCIIAELPQTGLSSTAGLLETVGKLNAAHVGLVADLVMAGTLTVHHGVALLA